MRENTTSKISGGFHRVAMAIVTIGIVTLPAVHAKPKSEAMSDKRADKIILVRPTDLPELARNQAKRCSSTRQVMGGSFSI